MPLLSPCWHPTSASAAAGPVRASAAKARYRRRLRRGAAVAEHASSHGAVTRSGSLGETGAPILPSASAPLQVARGGGVWARQAVLDSAHRCCGTDPACRFSLTRWTWLPPFPPRLLRSKTCFSCMLAPLGRAWICFGVFSRKHCEGFFF